jgi:iron complex outermembrane receptor protein
LWHNYKDNEYLKIAQEVRLDSSSDRLKWLLGFYYDNDNNDVHLQQDSIIPSRAYTTDREFNGDAYAVFGQVGYFFTERLRVVGGLRYGVQDQEYKNHVANTKYDDSWSDLSPKLALEYYFTPDIMAYISASKGYRSGGFNTVATDPQYRSYDEEELWSYEIGAKSAFLDNRIILNGAVYYMEIDDMQVYQADSPTMSYLTNATKATAIGVEGELRVKVTDELTTMAGFGYNHIEFEKYSDALGDYKDNKAPFAPEYTFNIGAQYRHGSGFYSRVDLIGYGEMFLDRANEYSRDPYEIVNLKIGYETEHCDIYLYGKNIFDEEYNSEGYYDGFYTLYSEPGEVGLQVVGRF